MSDYQFGMGAYTPAEAAALTGLSPSAIRRWLFGYSYAHRGATVTQRPLWQPEYGLEQDEPILGFRDLIEARMVGSLRRLGLGLPTIRQCLEFAAQIANDDHPFSSASFRTDGKNLLLERVGDAGEHDLIDLRTRQHTFAKVVESSFIDLAFDDEKATLWFPLAKKKTLVIDPERSFGQPIASDSGIPTKRLLQAVDAEGSVQRVAKLFDIAVNVVRDAVSFEHQRGMTAAT